MDSKCNVVKYDIGSSGLCENRYRLSTTQTSGEYFGFEYVKRVIHFAGLQTRMGVKDVTKAYSVSVTSTYLGGEDSLWFAGTNSQCNRIV